MLTGAINYLDQIWKVRNHKVHNEKDPDMVRPMCDINNRCRKFGALRYIHSSPSEVVQSHHWICPPHGCIKFNCDAAIGADCSCLVVVARD